MDMTPNSSEFLEQLISNPLSHREGLWCGPKGGYWSNLTKDQNARYMEDLQTMPAYEVMRRHFPQHEAVIFSPKRMGGIGCLPISAADVILDAGCMWGALSVPLARTGATVIAVDQTRESLLFLKRRAEDEGLANLTPICANLRELQPAEAAFDKIVVNGVLEWIPEHRDVEVDRLGQAADAGKADSGSGRSSPGAEQLAFLERMHRGLKRGGTLYLAIENRYDFLYFLGLPEPHCGVRFISLLPRPLQDVLFKLLRGKPFRTWTYSRPALRRLLGAAGFKNVEIKYAFPDYRMPELVLSDDGMTHFRACSPLGQRSLLKKIVVRGVERIVYKMLRLSYFAPAFVVYATK